MRNDLRWHFYMNRGRTSIRYYEKIGLLPQPDRKEGGHRIYTHDALKRLTFIRRSRDLGFSVAQVRDLLRLIDEPDHTCGEIKDMTLVHVKEVQRKIADLRRLEQGLLTISSQCKEERASLDNCPIINALYSDSSNI